MKIYPHSRPLLVLRRLRGFLASSGPDCPAGYLFSPRLAAHRGISAHHFTVKAAHPTQLRPCLFPLLRRRPIQST
jgi:hypothetical protein